MQWRPRRQRIMLITGGSGFLGRHLALASEADSWQLIAPPSNVVDIRDRDRVRHEITDWRPDAVVHLAYKRGDRRAIVDGSRFVAEAAAACGTRLIHLSTDVVFGGRPLPYTERDPLNPISDYGVMKADAERAVLSAYPRALVVRTSLLYGTARLSPIQTDVAKICAGEMAMTLFTDEYRCPVHAADLATALSTLAGRADLIGPLHVAGPEALSRYDLAVRFATWMGLNPALLTPGSVLDSGLQRPGRIVLDSSKAADAGIRCRSVQQALST